MAKKSNTVIKGIWLSALILAICVSATSVAFFSRMEGYLMDDEGAIPLIAEYTYGKEISDEQSITSLPPAYSLDAEDSADESDASDFSEQAPETEQSSIDSAETESFVSTAPQTSSPSGNPSFEVGDDQTVWSTQTQVEIFRISYQNGEQVITVHSNDGDKVIAPGTENSYTFKLKNTGDVSLDYTVEVEAYFSPADIAFPVSGRLNRYDGKWIVGGKDAYADVATLNTAHDAATLGAGKYTYYTLDWQWPFESGNDELDTMLGNLATEEDLFFSIVIKTTATESDDPNGGGIIPPQTGDNFNLAMWSSLAIGSFIMLMFLLLHYRKEKRRIDAEADVI